jgi:hypothetical protein
MGREDGGGEPCQDPSGVSMGKWEPGGLGLPFPILIKYARFSDSEKEVFLWPTP